MRNPDCRWFPTNPPVALEVRVVTMKFGGTSDVQSRLAYVEMLARRSHWLSAILTTMVLVILAIMEFRNTATIRRLILQDSDGNPRLWLRGDDATPIIVLGADGKQILAFNVSDSTSTISLRGPMRADGKVLLIVRDSESHLVVQSAAAEGTIEMTSSPQANTLTLQSPDKRDSLVLRCVAEADPETGRQCSMITTGTGKAGS